MKSNSSKEHNKMYHFTVLPPPTSWSKFESISGLIRSWNQEAHDQIIPKVLQLGTTSIRDRNSNPWAFWWGHFLYIVKTHIKTIKKTSENWRCTFSYWKDTADIWEWHRRINVEILYLNYWTLEKISEKSLVHSGQNSKGLTKAN